MDTTISGVAQTSVSRVGTMAVTSRNYYVTTFVSNPINQTGIAANTWTYAFSASESSTSCNFPCAATNQAVRVNCFVWRPSTGAKVGTILDGNTAITVDEGAVNVQAFHIVTFTGAAVASAAPGDVIIFEVWFVVTSTISTSQTLAFYYDGTTEYAENGTAGNAASYLSTPENLVFQSPAR